MHRLLGSITLLLAAALSGGCKQAVPASATTVVDSVVPREIALERFRRGLPQVDTLSGGARSRDALVQAFVRAAETRDTAGLLSLAMTRAEYAWIYYPTTSQGLPPYDLSPSLLWFMLDERGGQGAGHLLQERSGPLHVVGYSCDAKPAIEGENKVWGPCVLKRLQAPGDTIAERLFGSILEHRGRFKFVNLANRL